MDKQGKRDEAIQLAYSGALLLLQHHQVASAKDLIQRMMDLYDHYDLKPGSDPESSKNTSRLLDLCKLFPLDPPNGEVDYFKEFTRHCTR
jgi:hypothetical protein